MAGRSPAVDEYIAKAQPFARPILTYIRKAVHKGCPGVEEELKWRHPAFMYKGILAGMAAHKEHVTFGFWKASALNDRLGGKAAEAAGQFGRIASVDELPDERELAAMVKEAAALHDGGIKAPRKKTATKAPLDETPDDFLAALQEEQEGAPDLRRVQSQPQARIPRVDPRGQARRDTRETDCHRRRMDGRRQAAELEVHVTGNWELGTG